MKSFAESGLGVFPCPAGLAVEIERQHRVECAGVLKDATVSYHAITARRRVEHRGVEAIRSGSKG